MTYEMLFESLCDDIESKEARDRDSIIANIVNLPPVEADSRFLLSFHQSIRKIVRDNGKTLPRGWDNFWDGLVDARYIFQDFSEEQLSDILREYWRPSNSSMLFLFKHEFIAEEIFDGDVKGSNDDDSFPVKNWEKAKAYLDYAEKIVLIFEKALPRKRELWDAIVGVQKMGLEVYEISDFCHSQKNHCPSLLTSCFFLLYSIADASNSHECSALSQKAEKLVERFKTVKRISNM